MKPVNLLPSSERPRTAAAVPENASKAVIALLAGLVLAVGAFVFTKNQATDERAAIDEARQEKTVADQRASKLGSFGDFKQIKEARERSVTELATKRFDWERFMRELALVLPKDVFLTNVTAGSAEGGATADAPPAAGAAPSAATPGAATSSSAAPSVKLTGCAPSQKTVAATMVRLRQMHDAADVELQESKETPESAAGATPGASDGAGTGSASCGDDYQFDASVTFSTSTPTQGGQGEGPKRVPSTLGGGA